jgi:hypothetical protein
MISSFVACLILCTAAARAQYSEAGLVSGTGAVQIERLPEMMRMRVVVTAKGSTLEEALAALKDKTDAAKGQLATLGAAKDSVNVDAPQVAAETNDQRRQMQMMMAQRLRGNRRPPKKEETKPPVSLSATVTAEWPLAAKSVEELLVAATALQEKVVAADLAGAKEADNNLTPEEQEALEEMEDEMAMAYGGEEEAKPGEPVFLFVAAIAEAEIDKARAEAFQKAKSDAASLAKAAGAKLGKLSSVSGEAGAGIDTEDYVYGGYDSAAYQMMRRMQAGVRAAGAEPAPEAIGATPGKVIFQVTMTASFELAE